MIKYTNDHLKALEENIQVLKDNIKDGKFTFNETTEKFDFVFLANGKTLKEEYPKWAKELKEIEFKTEQKNLRYLDAGFCDIEHIVIRNCPNLETLYLNNNKLKTIVFEGKFPKLQFLNLDRNALTELNLQYENFPNLQFLYLYQNNLTDISNLAPFFENEDFDFNIQKNENIVAPPKGIVEEGKGSIKEWFRQAVKYEVEKAYEAKILIVGEAGAGKTTLMELLFDKNFKVPQPEQISTLGIEVRQNLVFRDNNLNLHEIEAHIWDFGGQDIQFMLHQYFLTDDSVYILIIDGRKGNTDFEYWFHIINLLGKHSPVLVLLNRKEGDSTIKSFDNNYYKSIFKDLKIFDCGEINFACLDKKWESFEQEIFKQLNILPVVGQKIIKPWKTIREELDKRKNENYITLKDFEKICENANLKEPTEQKYVLDYFHKIGIALNFSDEALQNNVFLNPNWITRAIYDVLDDCKIVKNGVFSKTTLFEHWQSKNYDEKHTRHYSLSECNALLLLMLKDKFDICYKLEHEEDKYIVPAKLLDKSPTYNLNFDSFLHFRFSYTFMPRGILSKLIVRFHKYIYEGLVWKTGCVFFNNDCFAEVIEKSTITEENLYKNISIKVSGEIAEKRRAFLKQIREEVEFIHKNTFPYIQYEDVIVCNCATCKDSNEPSSFTLLEIKDYLEGNKTQIYCRKAKKDVDIKPLLHEVYTNEEITETGVKKENKKTPQPQEVYDIARIKKLLLASFDSVGLEGFCQSYFPDVYQNMTAGQSQIQRIMLLADHCKLRGKFRELLEKIEEENEYQYKIYLENEYQYKIYLENEDNEKEDKTKMEGIIILPKNEILEKLNQLLQIQANQADINKVLNELSANNYKNVETTSLSVIKQTLEIIEQKLETIKNLNDKELVELKNKLKTETSTSAKIKLTLPLIPTILTYESDFAISGKQEFKSWRDFFKIFWRK